MSVILRFTFVLLLVLGVGERVLWYQAGHHGQDQMAQLAAGVTSIGLQNWGEDQDGLIDVAAPGCPAVFPIGLAALDGSEDARFGALLDASNHPLFIYLGRVETRRDARHAVTAWFGANAETMLGLRRDQAPNKLVLALLPDACPSLTKLDWAALSP